MEKVGPLPPLHAHLATGKVIPLGQGWVLEPLEAGFLLKGLAQAVQVQVTPEEAQSLRQGEVTAESLAARYGALPTQPPPHTPPGAAITVAFSDEALRLAGTERPTRKGGRAGSGAPQDIGAGAGLDLPRAARIGAVVVALMLLALIWAM